MQEAAQAHELAGWEAQLAAQAGRLLEATRANTARLTAVSSLTQQQRTLESGLLGGGAGGSGGGKGGKGGAAGQLVEDTLEARRQQVGVGPPAAACVCMCWLLEWNPLLSGGCWLGWGWQSV